MNNEDGTESTSSDAVNYTDDFARLTSDPDLTEEKLLEEMNKYEKAFEEEMNVKAEANPEDVEQHTSDFFRANAHFAAAQIVHLAMNAESETVRGSMSKYILDTAYKVEKESQDPIVNIIKKLQENDSKPQPANKEDENA